MADELHRAKKKKAAADDKEVWIRKGDYEAALPYSRARKWLQDNFGIDLDQEPAQDPDGPQADDAGTGQEEGGTARRFAGRRLA
jgi:hypothetical protein